MKHIDYEYPLGKWLDFKPEEYQKCMAIIIDKNDIAYMLCWPNAGRFHPYRGAAILYEDVKKVYWLTEDQECELMDTLFTNK